MRITPAFGTVAAGCIALGTLLMAQAVAPASAQPLAPVRAGGVSAVAADDDDVTWGS